MVPGGQRVGLQGPRGSWGSLQCPKGSSVLGVLLVQGVQMVQLVQVVQVVQVVRVAWMVRVVLVFKFVNANYRENLRCHACD